ncbi:MAG: ABC transporter permease subunit [Ruminococcaceae bacterium]|nr:ABC transporter permease subunit [Oscillospiraceae bacterium]
MMTSISYRNAPLSPQKRLLFGAVAVVLWVAVWWFVAWRVDQELLVPTPLLVGKTLWHLGQTSAFWLATVASLLRVAAGFAGGVVSGVILALLTYRFPLASHLFAPLLKTVRATPVASFIILAFVWLKTDILPAFIAFLMVLPIVWGNVDKGLRQTDRRLLETAYVFRLGQRRTVLHVWIPSVMPHFLTACTTALGLAWKSAVAAEVICRPQDSIGRLLQTAKNHLETAEVFAYTIAVIVLSVVLEHLFLALAKRLGRRFNAGEGV